MAIARPESLLSSPGRRVGVLLPLVLIVDLLVVLALGLMPLDSIAGLRCEAVLRGGDPETGLRLTASIEARKDILCDDAASGRRVTMLVAGVLVLLIGAGAVLAPADRLERALVRGDEEDDGERWEREAAQREADAREARIREERALADARRAAPARAEEDRVPAAGDRRAARVEKARAARLAARAGTAAKPGRKSARPAKKVVKPTKATAKGTKKAVTAGSAAPGPANRPKKVATTGGATSKVAKGTKKVATIAGPAAKSAKAAKGSRKVTPAAGTAARRHSKVDYVEELAGGVSPATTPVAKRPRKAAPAGTAGRSRGIKKVEPLVLEEVAPVTPAPAEAQVADVGAPAAPSDAPVTEEVATVGSRPAPSEAPVTEEVATVGPAEADAEGTVALDMTSPEAPEPTRAGRKAAKEAAKTEAAAPASRAGTGQKVGTSRRAGMARRAVGLGPAGEAGAEAGPIEGAGGPEAIEGGDAPAPPDTISAPVEPTVGSAFGLGPEATPSAPVEQDAVAPDAASEPAAPRTGAVRRVGTSRRAARGAPRP